MNKNVFAGVVAGVLVAGLVLGPTFSGLTAADAQVQPQPQGKIKPVTLVAREVVVDVAADNPAIGHPGGVQYSAMTFNGTIPAPVIAVDQGDTLRVTLINEGKTH